jgi:hypothetical protein
MVLLIPVTNNRRPSDPLLPETLAIEKEYAPLEHNPGAYSVGK